MVSALACKGNLKEICVKSGRYGVPAMAARRFEDVMRGHAPQRFSAERDILHQLITMLSPSLLSAQGEAGPESADCCRHSGHT